MRIEYFKTVLYVARYKSFSEAAFAIPCAQSSVSRQVMSVEEELGIRIFTRSSNSLQVELTKEGKQVIPKIRDIVERYETLVDTSIQDTGLILPVDIGVSNFVFPNVACGNIISNLYLTAPNVLVNFHKVRTSEMDDVLLSHIVDLGLSYRIFPGTIDQPRPVFPDIMEPLCALPICKSKLHICVSKDNPLSRLKEVTAEDIKDETFIFDRGIVTNALTTIHRCFLDYCLSAKFTPKMYIASHSYADVKLLLAQTGKGIFIDFIPHDKLGTPGLVSVPVADANFYAFFYMLTFKTNNKLETMQSLIEPMKELLKTDTDNE